MTEETAEELAQVISPELKPKLTCNPILKSASMTIDEAGSSILSQGVSGVTLLSIGEQINDTTTTALEQESAATTDKNNTTSVEAAAEVDTEDATLKESFSAKL